MEAGVLQHKHRPAVELSRHSLGLLADTIRREGDVFAQELRKMGGYRRHLVLVGEVLRLVKRLPGLFRLLLSLSHILLRIAQVRHQHKTLSLMLQHVLDSR